MRTHTEDLDHTHARAPHGRPLPPFSNPPPEKRRRRGHGAFLSLVCAVCVTTACFARALGGSSSRGSRHAPFHHTAGTAKGVQSLQGVKLEMGHAHGHTEQSDYEEEFLGAYSPGDLGLQDLTEELAVLPPVHAHGSDGKYSGGPATNEHALTLLSDQDPGCMESTTQLLQSWKQIICAAKASASKPVCSDTEGFVDKHGHGCREWENLSCKTIAKDNPAPAPCQDDNACLAGRPGWESFTCSKAASRFCANTTWAHDMACCPRACGKCSTRSANYGYDASDQAKIMQNCRRSCRICTFTPRPDVHCYNACSDNVHAMALWQCGHGGPKHGTTQRRKFRHWRACIDPLLAS